MKKAVEITNITIENRTATVTYITGTVRKYPEDKIPKTVQSWMEAHQEEAAEEPSYKEEAPEVITVATIQEPAQLPAVIEVTSTELQTNFKEDEVEAEADEEPVFTEPKASRLAEAVEAAKVAAMMIAKAAMAVAGAVQIAAPVLAKLLVVLAGKLVDGYYAVTTYVPIGSRWVAIHLVWFIQDSIPVVAGAVRKAGAAAQVAGRAFAHGAAVMAGWALVAALATVSTTIKAVGLVVEGWKLREEIIQEQKAA